MPKTALIAGGTGLVGSHLVRLLVETKAYGDIKVLVRKESTYHLNGVTVLEVDYEHLSDSKDDLRADVVFCCLGTTMKKAGSKERFYKVDFTYPYELAKLSQSNGSKQFNIITASGADPNSMIFYNRVKGEIENAVSKLDFQDIHIFRPSLLLGKRNEQRIGEQAGAVLAKAINPFLIGSLKKYRAIQAETVARAMVKVSGEEARGIRIYQSDIIQQYGQD